MKINRYVAIGVFCLSIVATTQATPLISAMPTIDGYFKSPSLIALAPLRSFFEKAGEATRSPKTVQNQAQFYSQAMSLYINKIYNSSDYARHLSQDSRHVTEFLSVANEFSLNTEQVYTGLRLFYNKMKETDLFDDTVTNHILEALPSELEAYFPLRADTTNKSQPSSAKMIENMILSQFTEHLTEPKVSNDQFFKELSEGISKTTSTPTQNDAAMMKERLRHMTIRFVEQLISKTMWYPQHHEGVWQSVLSAAHNIHLLCANGIVNHIDDRDDMLKSLVSRFNFFLEQYGGALPLSFYEQVEHDITHHLVFFLESPEVDEGVMSKKQLLLNALTTAKAKAIALHSHGLLPEEAQ